MYYEEILDEIEHHNDLASIHTILQRVAHRLGFAVGVYMLLPPQKGGIRQYPLGMDTLIKELDKFSTSYQELRLYDYDPSLRRARFTNVPFVWSECQEFSGWNSPKVRGRRTKTQEVMAHAYEYGYTDGYVIPAHAVGGQGQLVSALLSFFWQGDSCALQRRKITPAWLRLVATCFHHRVVALKQATDNDDIHLTPREEECLIWAARGKTRTETAVILNVKERTVEFHLEQAMNKFGVYNKAHAVVFAIQRGLIWP